MSTPPDPTNPDDTLRDIQGHIVGFNKDHMRLVFLRFGADPAQSKAFLTAMADLVATGEEVKAFNGLFKQITARRRVATTIGADDVEGVIESTWLNIALSAAGLAAISAPGIETFDPTFRNGMRAHASAIGDDGPSAPEHWGAPFDTTDPVHAMAILAADTTDDLNRGYTQLQTLIAAHQVTEISPNAVQDGSARPEPNAGKEHFGFKDGISQPSIDGLTTSSKDTGPGAAIAAGEFLIGHPDQTGAVSGQAGVPVPPPSVPADGYPPQPPTPDPTPAGVLPSWTLNGSFLVYRRLQQDVAAFQQFLQAQAAGVGLSPDQLGAKLMGRWPSGAPMETVAGSAAVGDPSTADPSTQDPGVLSDAQINAFDYGDDPDGNRVPRASHIRKTNTRNSPVPGKTEADRHRILRRGIPYGPDFQPGESAYNVTPATDTTDRGLLFLCFQASIDRGFAFIQQSWANTDSFPNTSDGKDPIISQDPNPHDFTIPSPSGNQHASINTWVTTRGGEYFFTPSISGLQTLGQ